MAKWGYLARAYAIKEYAYLRQTELENPEDARDKKVADSLSEVIKDLQIIMEMAEENLYDDYSYNYRTIKQCKKFFADFQQTGGR